MRRVLSLPVEEVDGTRAAEKWTELLGKPSNGMPLRKVQGEVLETVHRNLSAYLEGRAPLAPDGNPYGPVGLLGPIGVGHGKTFPTFLLPEVVRRLRGSVRPMLLVPSNLVHKTRIDHAEAQRHYRYPIPNIVSMGLLSHPKHTGIFEKHAPDLVIIDEAHALANHDATRTKRLTRWILANRDCVVVALSGTLTSKSIQDYKHISELALRDMTPIPEEAVDLEFWQAMLDVGGKPDYAARKAIRPLVEWHHARTGQRTPPTGQITKDMAREAFRYRLQTVPGVVATSDAGCDASLNVRKWRVELPASWQEAVEEFGDSDEAYWEMPDGTEVVDALTASRAQGQLSSGYYTRWEWPERACPGHWGALLGQYTGCEGEACSVCEGTGRYAGPDHEWLELRKTWSSVERHTLRAIEQKTGQDSPALIRRLAKEGKLGRPSARALQAWEDVKPRHVSKWGFQPPVVYEDLEPGPEWLAARAVEWAKVVKRGIIWYATPHVGLALAQAGFRVFGAGTSLDSRSALRIDTPCAKIDVQGEGKNLQIKDLPRRGVPVRGWDRNLALEFGGNARVWEQKLGRTHRAGQTSDEVWLDVLVDGGVRSTNLMSAKLGAAYIELTTGMRQRLRYATYLPEISGDFIL
jgi:hypothetical protein